MNKKRLLLIPVMLVMLLAMTSCEINIFGYKFGGSESSAHTHTYGDLEVLVSPTCTAKGSGTQKCTSCGETVRVEIAAGHNFSSYKVTKEATCTKTGSKERECSRCYEKETAVIEATGHSELAYTVTKAATCTEAGKKTAVCSKCHTEFDEEIPATGHNVDSWTVLKSGSCTVEGTKMGTCSKCSRIVTENFGGTHVYEASVKKTEYGHSKELHKCKDCDDHYYTNLSLDYTKLYGYQKLGTYSSGAKYQAMYASLFNDLTNVLSDTTDYGADTAKIVSYEYAKAGLTEKEAAAVFATLKDENPEFYFLSNGFTQSYSTLAGKPVADSYTMYLLISSDYYLAETRADYKEKLNALEKALTANYSETKTNLVAKYIHNEMASRIEYAYVTGTKTPETAAWAHSMAGLLYKAKGVCECYAKSYLYFSYLFGLNSLLVTGTGTNSYGQQEAHAWNYTNISGKWYGVDATWDDQSTIKYTYFLGNKSAFSDHTVLACNFDKAIENNTISFQIDVPELSVAAYA